MAFFVSKELKKWNFRNFLNKIKYYVLAISFLLSFLVILLTIYGQSTGNFLITIGNNSISSLSLSYEENFTEDNSETTLHVEGIDKMLPTTYGKVYQKVDPTLDGANNIDNDIICFSFYMKNVSPVAKSVQMNLDVDGVHNQMDEIIRIMIIEDEDLSTRKIYSDVDEFGKPYELTQEYLNENQYSPQYDMPYTTLPFASTNVLVKQDIIGMKAQEQKKYTIAIWMEGHDPRCDDTKQGSKIKLSMNFEISE